MVFCSIFAGNQNGVVPPADTLRTDDFGKTTECIHYVFFIRNIWLKIFPVRSDRHGPELTERSKIFQMLQHGLGIFSAESQHIHDRRIDPVPVQDVRRVGTSGQNVSLTHAVHKPFRIKCRNICPVSGVEDHTFFPLSDVHGLRIFRSGQQAVLSAVYNKKPFFQNPDRYLRILLLYGW